MMYENTIITQGFLRNNILTKGYSIHGVSSVMQKKIGSLKIPIPYFFTYLNYILDKDKSNG